MWQTGFEKGDKPLIFRSGQLLKAALAGWLCLLASLAPVWAQPADKKPGSAQPAGVVPLFRHIDPTQKDPDFKAYPIIRFAVSDDFPPFAFRNKDGALSGFNVAIANTVCKVLRVECRFLIKPFSKATAAVENGKADALITGLVQNSQTEKTLVFSRPYYRFTARFAVRAAAPIKKINLRSLAGKRLGAVANSQHEAFLKTYFKRSKIRGFKTQHEAFEALRTGAVDAVFDDTLKLMFWLKGTLSKNCCRFTGGTYVSPRSFSLPMSIAVKRGNVRLLRLIDHALDRLQITGRYERIFRQYFPLAPWAGPDQQAEPSNNS